jgi:hypothetical protein
VGVLGVHRRVPCNRRLLRHPAPAMIRIAIAAAAFYVIETLPVASAMYEAA